MFVPSEPRPCRSSTRWCSTLDGTLCRREGDIDAVYRAAFDRVGVDPFAVWDALDGPPDPDDRIGYLGVGFARLAARNRRDVDPLALAEAFVAGVDEDAVGFLPGAEATLERVAERTAVGLLTNGPSSRQAAKVDTLGLDRLDAVVYAGDLPRRKPHAAPFHRVLSELDVDARPAATLCVDDSLAHDVAGAHTTGLQAAWLRRGDGSPAPYHPEYASTRFRRCRRSSRTPTRTDGRGGSPTDERGGRGPAPPRGRRAADRIGDEGRLARAAAGSERRSSGSRTRRRS